MNSVTRHLTRCFVAGIVTLLPIGGLVLTVGYLEQSISSTGLASQPFYFPGLGLLLACAVVYGVGLVATTFIGNWAWKRIDLLLHRLPALGAIYGTLKQILGYGEGRDAIFHESVLVRGRDQEALEFGLVTHRFIDEQGVEQLLVFVPGSPNPSAGRLVLSPAAAVQPIRMPVSDTLKTLVSVGKSGIDLARPGDPEHAATTAASPPASAGRGRT